MRLLKLSLEDWRGVDSRHVVFSEGVTLIEGPNEIGKSTIVEAIRMLFNELDSSKKQTVKAIKPVDRDVGSTVEVEVTSGDYHFVYSKTYNKSPQTTLDVLAPKKRQVTGREAHEAVEQMLAETVDMALWEALLVDQGEKVALANIQNSAGLANALDDAAGAAATGSDDTDLYEAAQAEYERYFTLKTGRPKFAGEEEAFKKAEQSLEDAERKLAKVEETAQAHDRSAAEVLRIKAELPSLEEIAGKHAENWKVVRSLEEAVNAKAKELADAQSIQKAAIDALKHRQDLVDDVSKNTSRVDEAKLELEPLRQSADKARDQIESVQLEIVDLRKKEKAAKADFEESHADERHLRTLEALAKEQARLKLLKEIAKGRAESLEITGKIRITNDVLETLRDAESRVAIARGTRNTAATTVSIKAEKNLTLEVDGSDLSIEAGKTDTRTAASLLHIRLPGVATFEVAPPQSVAELQAELDESEEVLSRLKSQYEVADLKEAVAANERRAEAQQNINRSKAREKEILDGTSVDEIEQAIASYDSESARYAEQRRSETDLPTNLADAASRVSKARSQLTVREKALEDAQEKNDALQKEHADLDAQLRIAQQNLAGLEAALADKEKRLQKLRAGDSDNDLAERATKATEKVDKLDTDAAKLREKLDESSPDSVEALMNNAQAALERARSDAIKEEQDLAVLSDRLQQAQADGRFEAREAAERELEEARRKFESTRRRAEAIDLLWKTLDKHRNAARKAYVRPLKEAIERLGRIAFGADFEIDIGEDWTVLTRTQNGITLPFDSLSVGVKEQIGILARLAAAQIVAKQGGVPLIIDDALGFSDPSRLETIGAAIAAAGKESQIIILTCTPGRFTHVGSAEVVRF